MEQPPVSEPCIDRICASGLAVHVDEQRIDLLRIEVGGFQQPAIERHASADVHAQKLGLGRQQWGGGLTSPLFSTRFRAAVCSGSRTTSTRGGWSNVE